MHKIIHFPVERDTMQVSTHIFHLGVSDSYENVSYVQREVPKFALMICWLFDAIFSHHLFAMGSFCDIFKREVHAISIDISHIYHAEI